MTLSGACTVATPAATDPPTVAPISVVIETPIDPADLTAGDILEGTAQWQADSGLLAIRAVTLGIGYTVGGVETTVMAGEGETTRSNHNLILRDQDYDGYLVTQRTVALSGTITAARIFIYITVTPSQAGAVDGLATDVTCAGTFRFRAVSARKV